MPPTDPAALRQALEPLAAAAERLRRSGARVLEAEGKRLLIEPVLRLLGWDLDGVGEVRQEWRLRGEDDPADYAFLAAGRPVMILEAKRPDERLDGRRGLRQALNYAHTAGAGWAVLSNGLSWRVYRCHARTDIERRLWFDITLADAARSPEAAAKLWHLRRDAVLGDATEAAWTLHAVAAAFDAMLRRGDRELAALLARRLEPQLANESRIRAVLPTLLDDRRAAAPSSAALPPAARAPAADVTDATEAACADLVPVVLRRRGIVARGMTGPGRFVILRGSDMRRDQARGADDLTRLHRERLLRGGIVAVEAGGLRFAVDHDAGDPALAARLVTGATRADAAWWRIEAAAKE